MKQSWSIVVFCYNESGSILTLLNKICEIFDKHRPGLYEVIVVDDGSTDDSLDKINMVTKTRQDIMRVIKHQKNLGIGETLRDGYMAAKNENLSAIPGDAQFNVEELIPYLSLPQNTFISFYRIENIQYTKFRTLLSSINKWVNKICNGIVLKDVNWVKIYKNKDIKSFPWELHSSLVESEICAKLIKSGRKPTEVLSYYHPRISGKSRGASFKVIIKAASEVLKLIWIMNQFKSKIDK